MISTCLRTAKLSVASIRPMPRRSHHGDRTPTHGYEPTREAAMAAFAKRAGGGNDAGFIVHKCHNESNFTKLAVVEQASPNYRPNRHG
jgi:hypothetical protein